MNTFQICIIGLALMVASISCDKKQDKRGLLDLGYGYSGSVINGGIIGHQGALLTHGGHGLGLGNGLGGYGLSSRGLWGNGLGLGNGIGLGSGIGLGNGIGLGSGIGLGAIGTHTQSVSTINEAVPIEVPQPYAVTVNRPVGVPVPVRVPVDVPRPVPVEVPQPYAVDVPRPVPVVVKRPVAVPVPQPVHVPVAKPVPVAVPHPVPVQVNRPVAVRVPTPVVVQEPIVVGHGGWDGIRLGGHGGGWDGSLGHSAW